MDSNKIKLALVSLFIIGQFAGLQSQTTGKYWIKFKDKNNSPYSISNPSAFLTAKSIARRTNQSIAIDITDIPVNQSYIDQVNATGAQVFQRSKWLNAAIVIVTNTVQLTAINSLTCVLNSSPVGKYYRTTEIQNASPIKYFPKSLNSVSGYNYGPSLTQVSQIGADCMHENGYRGQNMTIAVIDAGFMQADINPVFDSLRNENRILGTRDYVMGNTAVYEDHLHGANCLSLLAGNSPGNLIGTAPKASYWLLRSEDAPTEKIIEECNWVVAAEFADSVGVDITTTSLGYTTFDPTYSYQNHVYADLNGKTSVASIAATMAVRKGIFVLNAAGNEGGGAWRYIGVPADADSICTVGAVNGSGIHSNFSSVGPTSDGRIKPELSAMGEGSYVCNPGYSFSSGNGTSYATPILAGAVACLWQANPTKTNMQILEALKSTASQSASPNNDYGWGIPNMCAAHNLLNGTFLAVGENKKQLEINLFPNPAANEINFKLNSDIDFIEVTDVLGKIYKTSFVKNDNSTFNVKFGNNLSSGVYFIVIHTAEGFFKSKFVRE
jgi:serine protease AprX